MVALGGATIRPICNINGVGATVSVALPVNPPNDAVIVAVPAETPVASPELLTVATEGLELVQVACVVTASSNGAALYSARAVNCCVWSTSISADEGLTDVPVCSLGL